MVLRGHGDTHTHANSRGKSHISVLLVIRNKHMESMWKKIILIPRILIACCAAYALSAVINFNISSTTWQL